MLHNDIHNYDRKWELDLISLRYSFRQPPGFPLFAGRILPDCEITPRDTNLRCPQYPTWRKLVDFLFGIGGKGGYASHLSSEAATSYLYTNFEGNNPIQRLLPWPAQGGRKRITCLTQQVERKVCTSCICATI